MTLPPLATDPVGEAVIDGNVPTSDTDVGCAVDCAGEPDLEPEPVAAKLPLKDALKDDAADSTLDGMGAIVAATLEQCVV
jgi:hypothetical protein